MSEILNSYADSVVEKKGNKKLSELKAEIESLYKRVAALESGGSGGEYIPLPDSPSNGDVLTFDGTSWDGAAPPIASFIITAEYDGNDDYVLNKSYNEIRTAIENWKICYVRSLQDGGSSYFLGIVLYASGGDGYYCVSIVSFNPGTGQCQGETFSSTTNTGTLVKE